MSGSDPAFPRKRNLQEVMALAQQGRSLDGTIPQSWLDEVIGGLTKRQLFAAMAMQGIMAHCEHSQGFADNAISAVAQADALLAELEKKA